MINKFVAATTIAAFAVTSFASIAQALPRSASPGSRADATGGFYATPIQKGAPRDLPGEQLIPGAPLVVDVIDGVTRPLIVDPIQSAGAGIALPALPILGDAAPAPAAAPMRMHRHHHMMHHHHHAMKHHMSKHHIMKKKKMM